MNAVIEHGTPLVDDPDRIGKVTQLGVDETSFLTANRSYATIYATGLVDLRPKSSLTWSKATAPLTCDDMTNADPKWLKAITVVATDLAESFRAGLSPGLDHATRVADPFGTGRMTLRRVVGRVPTPRSLVLWESAVLIGRERVPTSAMFSGGPAL